MIKIRRGDIQYFTFKRKNENGETITTIPKNIYFSVKESYNSRYPIIQKTLNDMTMDVDGTYHFRILPIDTNKLKYGNYVYDLEVYDEDNYVKTISIGEFRIIEEVTFNSNEV